MNDNKGKKFSNKLLDDVPHFRFDQHVSGVKLKELNELMKVQDRSAIAKIKKHWEYCDLLMRFYPAYISAFG